MKNKALIQRDESLQTLQTQIDACFTILQCINHNEVLHDEYFIDRLYIHIAEMQGRMNTINNFYGDITNAN